LRLYSIAASTSSAASSALSAEPLKAAAALDLAVVLVLVFLVATCRAAQQQVGRGRSQLGCAKAVAAIEKLQAGRPRELAPALVARACCSPGWWR
jgi:hypothetical protein